MTGHTWVPKQLREAKTRTAVSHHCFPVKINYNVGKCVHWAPVPGKSECRISFFLSLFTTFWLTNTRSAYIPSAIIVYSFSLALSSALWITTHHRHDRPSHLGGPFTSERSSGGFVWAWSQLWPWNMWMQTGNLFLHEPWSPVILPPTEMVVNVRLLLNILALNLLHRWYS